MRITLLCALAIFLGTSVLAQSGPDLSLSDAIQLGLKNNYQIRLAANDLEVARSNDDYALTGKRPTITLGLSPGVSYRNNTNPASIVSQSSTFSYNVSPNANLNWTLFNGGRVEIAKDQLSTLADLSAGQLQLQVENSIQSIIQAYYNAVVQREQVDVLQRVLDLSRDQIEYQEVRQEFGQGGSFDELQARDAYLTDSTSLVVQETTYRNALRNLLQLMGEEDLSQDFNLTTELTFTPEAYDRQALEDQMQRTNSQLRNLQINRELARINTQLIETEYKPTVSINAGAAYDINIQTGSQTFDFGGDQPTREQELPGVAARTLSGNLGIQANYLLFDGGARNVRTQTAKLQEITAQLNYQSTQQQLSAALQNSLQLYENQVQIVRITEELINNAEQNLTVAEERFRGGRINSFDYRAIQVNYINAQFRLLNALLNLKNTETELLRLTGQIVD
ncbi:TolC family protein [Lewinella sp. W8]|uniref:TolC family protein n=1 Tax=Lewinella sp. W8 TaxID=2528208 RepID=UPI0015637A06|nr:TolC family protein [Lewinella sp. W8]